MSVFTIPSAKKFSRSKTQSVAGKQAIPAANKAARSSGALPTPEQVGTLAMRYRADQGITIATGVSQWNDISGNGFNMLQGTAGAQPVFTAASASYNNQPVLTPNGTSHFMQATVTAIAGPPYTVYFVGNIGTATGRCAWGYDNNVGFFDHQGASTVRLFGGATLSAADSGISGGMTVPHSYICVVNGTSSAVYVDGALFMNGNAGNTAVSQNLQIFGSAAAEFWNGPMAELGGYASALVGAQVTSLASYLRMRYGTP